MGLRHAPTVGESLRRAHHVRTITICASRAGAATQDRMTFLRTDRPKS